ncbi:RagB/SusD family nutrient uptake outer membrane protein [Olivibacter sp. CPCC 100613]|uniref:RagB/SusD family nutrient uptake outer membrane protein n=1 Tax=Olivibacter sp. CPCC 100613 TaxID=3079931 RepID=UPI002FF7CB24
MKRLFHLYILLPFLFLLSGCGKSFLDLAPISNANQSNFYQTIEDFDLAVNSAYATLYTCYGPTSAISYFAEQLSDNATLYNVAGIQSDRWAFKDYNLKPSNTEIYRFWQESYKALFNINIVLDKISTAALNEEYKTQVMAQMRFIRALYYFNMVQMWGDIPLVTKPISVEESYATLRSPQAEVYAFVLEDLEYAAANLPEPAAITAVGKASKYAALTLLGKVFLTLNQKDKAAANLLQVYGKYSLMPRYEALWGANVKNTAESIFEIQYQGGSPNLPFSRYWREFAPTENFVLTLYGGGMNQVTDDLYAEFEEGDPRREQTVSLGYTNKEGTFIPIKFQNKWVDKEAPAPSGEELSNNNFMVLRYADVLLMLTEATDDPRYLNEVRARVNLPSYGSDGYPADYNSLALAIEHERRVEFALEFHRFFDLKRTNRAVTVVSKTKPIKNENQTVFPIPQIVIQQNPAITQNPAYQGL